MKTTLTNNGLFKDLINHLKPVSGPDANGNYLCWCPFHPDGKGEPPHRPNMYISDKGFICFACDEKGSLSKLAKKLGLQNTSNVRRIEKIYDYLDESGNLLFQVVRCNDKKFFQRQPGLDRNWRYDLKNTRRVLYKLPELIKNTTDPIFIVEGEKDVETLNEHGFLATTNPGGVLKWRDEYNPFFKGRNTILIPDNDSIGKKHAESVKQNLLDYASTIKVLELPGLPEKGDITDWFSKGNTTTGLLELIENTPCVDKSVKVDVYHKDLNCERYGQKTDADQILSNILSKIIQYFLDSNKRTYVRIFEKKVRKDIPILSNEFNRWLINYLINSGYPVPKQDLIQRVRLALDAKVAYEGTVYNRYIRLAEYQGNFYYDLDGTNVICANENGWRVINDPPVFFDRHQYLRPLPKPDLQGSYDSLFDFINIQDSESRMLFLVYLGTLLVPDIQIPILILHGPKGSGKTTIFKLIKRLLDPTETEIRGDSIDQKSLAQLASKYRILLFDNIRNLNPNLSDELCRITSKGGHEQRKLYSDFETVIFEYKSVLGINGINFVVKQKDLLDRCITFNLDPLPNSSAMDELHFWNEFEKAIPSILGGLFNAFTKAINHVKKLPRTGWSRMASFEMWGTAFAEAFGHKGDEFRKIYASNKMQNDEYYIENQPLLKAINFFMADKDEWAGTSSQFASKLAEQSSSLNIQLHSNPRRLISSLYEISSLLKEYGLTIEKRRTAEKRLIVVKKEMCF